MTAGLRGRFCFGSGTFRAKNPAFQTGSPGGTGPEQGGMGGKTWAGIVPQTHPIGVCARIGPRNRKGRAYRRALSLYRLQYQQE